MKLANTVLCAMKLKMVSTKSTDHNVQKKQFKSWMDVMMELV